MDNALLSAFKTTLSMQKCLKGGLIQASDLKEGKSKLKELFGWRHSTVVSILSSGPICPGFDSQLHSLFQKKILMLPC